MEPKKGECLNAEWKNMWYKKLAILVLWNATYHMATAGVTYGNLYPWESAAIFLRDITEVPYG